MVFTAPIDKPLLLLVDDMPANLHVLAAALKQDYRLKTATRGRDALAIMREEPRPELVLLDVMMPEMSGIEVLRRLREAPETRDTPVIFVTADVSEQSQLDGLELGADDYLTKPVIASVLRTRVKNLLAKKRSERQLRLAAHVFEHSGEAIIITDRDNCIIEVNPAFARLTGYSAEEARGQNPRFLSSGRTPPETYSAMWQALQETGFWQGELWDRSKNGGIYPKLLSISTMKNERGEIEYYIGSFTDISEQKASEEKIRHLAHHDALTGLPNRLFLTVACEQAIASAAREGRRAALIFLDMDRFKLINDTLGHQVGDEFLIEVGRRLKASVREADIVARLGGDEFVVMLTRITAQNDAARVADKILTALNAPFTIGSHTLHSSPSLGIALYPEDGTDLDTLMKNADTAMYHAKEKGRNNAQFFTAALNATAAERLELERALREALADYTFELHYQPQLCAKTRQLCGAEALLRWTHPTRGAISPMQFIPIAEETGLIGALGAWALDEACRQLAAWRAQGLKPPRVAINLSALQLREADFAAQVAATLARHGISPTQIELEITESAAMTDPQKAIVQLSALRALGVRLAIDDFGTGHSSLAWLKHLPIQALKLDRSFVKDIETDPNDAAICRATIALAHELGLDIVAEGVETPAQEAFLIERHGCDILQGFLYGKPMPATEFVLQIGRA